MRAAPLLAPAAALLALGPSLAGGFLNWDDAGNVVHNPWLGTPRALTEAFASTLYGHFQPLAWYSLALDRRLWGLRPFGFHLTNLLLHAAAAYLLFRLFRELLGAREGAEPAAALAAALWAAHPLRVEPVAWVTERRELLAALFLLLAALLRRRGSGRGALAAFAAACLSKVTAAMFPFVLAAWDHAEGRDWRRSLKENGPMLALSAAALFLGVRAQQVSGTAVPLALFSVPERLGSAAFAPGYYALKTLLPYPLDPFVFIAPGREPLRFAAYASLTAALLAWAWRRRRDRRALGTAAAALLFLLPSLGFFKSGPQTAADRFAHMASVPLAAAAAFALARSRAARRAAAAALCLLLPLSWAQCAVWHDSVSLWGAAFRRAARPAPLVLQNLAAALRESGRETEAAPLFARLAAEAPASPAAAALRGDAAYERGDYAAAASAYEEALSRDGGLEPVRVSHGLALFRLGRFAEAEAEFAAAAAAAPDDAEAWHDLGICLARRGAREPAARAFARALELSPRREDTRRAAALLRGAK